MKRGQQVKLSRLRIGHTRLTHCHLMEKSPQPNCTMCSEPLTVKHVLIACPQYANTKTELIFPNELRTLLGPICPIEMLVAFLQKTNLYDKI